MSSVAALLAGVAALLAGVAALLAGVAVLLAGVAVLLAGEAALPSGSAQSLSSQPIAPFIDGGWSSWSSTLPAQRMKAALPEPHLKHLIRENDGLHARST